MTTRTKIISGVATVIVLGGGFWFLQTGRTEIKFDRISPEQASKAAEVLSKDMDADGLKDWEEELWHSDPLKPDTDGDKTLDGEEIKLGRDPLKAGPGDKLDKETVEKRTVPGGGDWTETDRLSRELFAKYLTMRKSGAPFTAEDEEKLLEEFTNRPIDTAPQKIYTEDDIVLAKTDTGASLHAYGNALGSVITAHIDTGENELTIFERALQNEDELDLGSLDNRVKRYESILSGFKAIPAPMSVKGMHIALLNALEALKESVAGMALALTDPVHSLPAAVAYPTAVEKLATAFSDISSYFAQKQVTFGKEEGGYILTK
ncbi:MAG: hypothetical protein Q7R64_03085 [bacterium]|nr:hypothetical protein [bacterium]